MENGNIKNEAKIAFFVSSHGFGHAARISAIIAELLTKYPHCLIDIYSETPQWFFDESISGYRNYYHLLTDIGVVQSSPLQMNILLTLSKVSDFLNDLPEKSEQLAQQLRHHEYQLVISDISPLGITAAKKAHIPVILLENFTWDWIYEPFSLEMPAFKPVIQKLAEIYQSTDYHCQYQPACHPCPQPDLIIPPVSRKPRTNREETRSKLGLNSEEKLGLISMGGIPEDFRQAKLFSHSKFPGKIACVGSFDKFEKHGNLINIPHHSVFFHPDLIEAADFVIGKAGYSTMAEIYNAAKPFGYLLRPDFRESPVLGKFLSDLPYTIEVEKDKFDQFELDEYFEKLMVNLSYDHPVKNGSEVAADFILKVLQQEQSFPALQSTFQGVSFH